MEFSKLDAEIMRILGQANADAARAAHSAAKPAAKVEPAS
jgi:hypothetical protein